jgi:hypothetical protein
MLARPHCRRSQQEIKGYLWYDGHCLTGELAAVCRESRTGYARRFIRGEPQNRTGDFPRIRPSAEQAHFRAPSFDIFASLS